MRIARRAELGGDLDRVVAMQTQGFANHCFGGAHAVSRRAVDMGNSGIERSADQAQRLALARPAGQPRGAEDQALD